MTLANLFALCSPELQNVDGARDERSVVRTSFSTAAGGVECDADGLRVGGVALLARNAKHAWTRRDEGEINREPRSFTAFRLDLGRKREASRRRRRIERRRAARARYRRLAAAASHPPVAPAPDSATWKAASRPRAPPPAGREADADSDDKHRGTGRRRTRLVRPTSRAPGADAPKTEHTQRRACRRAAARRSASLPAPGSCLSPTLLLAEDLSVICPARAGRGWPDASPPRRSCSTRSSCRATSASSRRAPSRPS